MLLQLGRNSFAGARLAARQFLRSVLPGRTADQEQQPPGTYPAPQAPSRASPGEGATGERLPRALGGPRGDHSPGGNTADPRWLTIGGGRARRETLAQAGARELREEAGITVDPAALGEPLGTSVVRYSAFGLVPVTQYQTYFAVAVDDVEVGRGHQGLIERLGIERHEWLTADELERRPERAVGPDMPGLMRAAVAAVRDRDGHG